MRARCHSCGDEHDLIPMQQRRLLHMLPELRSPLEIVDPYACANCGREIRTQVRYVSTDKRFVPTGPPSGDALAERRMGHVWSLDGRSAMSLNYPAVSLPGGTVLFPAHEGRLSGALVIDQYGDPDLMSEFAAEYLKQYRVLVPKGRLPQRMTEMMPALHLLLNAAELALKADLIRSGRPSDGHVLGNLYRRLEDEHKDEIARRFASTAPIADLTALGADHPTVESVLGVYERSFGSTVYQDTRYLAEPTSKLREASLKGGNLVKDTPYPIFLPRLVQTMLEAYPFFSGAERLKRLGARVAHGSRDPGNDQHGDWGLVPSSIGLVVIRVAQFVARDKGGEVRDAFRRFKAARPPGYCTSWMYGGNTLLFYRAGEAHPPDGEATIDGLECKVWSTGRLGVHARDLYQLANALEVPDRFPEFRCIP